MARQAAELRYAVRFRVVFKYFGQLCLVLAALSLVPLVMSTIFGDTPISVRYGIVVGGLAAFGAGLARLRAPSRVQANEGMALVALIFLFTPLVMSFPMMGSGLSFPDAFFEAVSGVTTTGLSTKATLVDAPQTFLFARAWMQWYGGLGIVVLSLALVMQPGLIAKGLAATETETDDLVGGTRAYARRALKVYCILTALGIIGSRSQPRRSQRIRRQRRTSKGIVNDRPAQTSIRVKHFPGFPGQSLFGAGARFCIPLMVTPLRF